MAGKVTRTVSDQEIAAAFISGSSARECAKRFNLHQSTIQNILNKMKVPRRPRVTKEERRAKQKAWATANPEKLRQHQATRRRKAECKDDMASRYQADRLRILAKARERYQKNRECVLARTKKSRDLLRAKDEAGYKSKRAASAKARRLSSPKAIVHNRMSCQIRGALANGKSGRSWRSMVSYTVDDLVAHLLTTMPDGFNWSDVVSGALHIDHKIPVSAFNFSSPEDHDFKRCWSLENLQLLPALENIKKGAKLTAPFQPTLF